MNALAPAVAGTYARATRAERRGWIESVGFDLAFFVLAPVVTLPIILGYTEGSRLALVAGFLLAYPHYLSTFTFYLWDDNRARHRERILAFGLGPLLLCAGFVLLAVLEVPFVIQVLLFFWNTYHVARQSAGILSLYRHRAGISAPHEKQAANAAILATNVWFCLWNVETHPQLYAALTGLAAWLPRVAWLGAGVVALATLARLSHGLWRRHARSRDVTLPELAFLGTSLALFHPYLWIDDSAAATFAMLIPHYLQYLGLVWLLHRRRFPEPVGSLPQRALQFVAARTPVLVVTLAGIGFLFLGANVVSTRIGHKYAYESFYLLLAFVHFYLDGLFWAFKDPHVRRTIAPFLTGGGAERSAIAT